MGCSCASAAGAVEEHHVQNGKGLGAGKAATAAPATSSRAPAQIEKEASPGLRAAASFSGDTRSPPPSSLPPAPLATGAEASQAAVTLTVVSPTCSELDAVRMPPTPRGTRQDLSDAKLRSAASTPALGSSPRPVAPGVGESGSEPAAGAAPSSRVLPPAPAPESAPKTSAENAAASANVRYPLPGAIHSPRTPRRDLASGGLSRRPSGANVDKALAALDDRESTAVDLDEAFALLESPKNEDADSGKQRIARSDSRLESRPVNWPTDVEVTAGTRVLLLTWARWSKNSLRIQAEEKIKALQHVRHPRTEPRSPPLSPQPTPRETPRDAVAPSQSSHRSLRFGALSREETVTSRATAKPRDLLFDKMAEEQRDQMEAQAMRAKLNKNFAIEGPHTTSSKTPGFGIDTPDFPMAAKSRASPMESIVSSGVATPAQGGQLSPWLLEAEALLTGDDDIADRGPDVLRTSMAWGFPFSSPASGPSSPVNAPSSSDGASKLQRSPTIESDGPIDYEDELEKVCVFVTANMDNSTTTPGGVDADGIKDKLTSQSADSLASTAITLGEEPNSPLRSSPEKSADTSPGRSKKPKDGTMHEYTIGEKVSYWSASKAVWLPARIVERKSKHIYLVDKQMKGCLSKVRASELVSEAEEQKDPVLRAFNAFEPVSRSPGGQHRHTASGTGAVRSGKEHVNRSGRNGMEGCPPRLPTHPEGRVSPRTLPPLEHSPRTSPYTMPLDSLGAASPRSPARGRIVRDDFSDDSEDD